MESDGSNARHQHSHENGTYHRVELITGRLRRRSWSSSEKAEIVAESMEPGASVTAVARRHQLSRGLLWAWRRQAVDHLVSGAEASFVPLHLAAEPVASTASANDVRDKVDGVGRAGSIDIEIGGACVRVHGAVDPDALRQVLGLIGRLPDLGIPTRPGLRIMVASQPVDFRKGSDSLAALVTQVLAADPFAGDVFVFRSKRSDRVKLLLWDGSGLCLVSKRLESGSFTWPAVRSGVMSLSATQLRLLFAGMDWMQIPFRKTHVLEKSQPLP